MQEPSSNALTTENVEIIALSIDTETWLLLLTANLWLILLIVIGAFISWYYFIKHSRYKLVKLNISLGKIGRAEFTPNAQDIQIAHRIWTELITRKAALPFDPNEDVILEVYNSWYKLFSIIRVLISDIPADLLRSHESTREIVRISTVTLNDGLRPHLTKWQAKYRKWCEYNDDKYKDLTPQEMQRKYPQYNDLVGDIVSLNKQLVQYAGELKKIVDG